MGAQLVRKGRERQGRRKSSPRFFLRPLAQMALVFVRPTPVRALPALLGWYLVYVGSVRMRRGLLGVERRRSSHDKAG